MIDLNALDNDPWKTTPVQKDDLRALAAALQSMERDLSRVTKDASLFYETLIMIAQQNVEPKSAMMARRALGLEPVMDKGLII